MTRRAPVLLVSLSLVLTPWTAHADTASAKVRTTQGRNVAASADYYVNSLCHGILVLTPQGRRLINIARDSNPFQYDTMWAEEAKGPITTSECETSVLQWFGPQGDSVKQIGAAFTTRPAHSGGDLKAYSPDVQAEICEDIPTTKGCPK